MDLFQLRIGGCSDNGKGWIAVEFGPNYAEREYFLVRQMQIVVFSFHYAGDFVRLVKTVYIQPTFRPARIEGNISEYLMRMDIQGKIPAWNEIHFLVIEEALNIPEQELLGVVWVD